jgi:hypothetical protein
LREIGGDRLDLLLGGRDDRQPGVADVEPAQA